jgi:hypothetical protein
MQCRIMYNTQAYDDQRLPFVSAKLPVSYFATHLTTNHAKHSQQICHPIPITNMQLLFLQAVKP